MCAASNKIGILYLHISLPAIPAFHINGLMRSVTMSSTKHYSKFYACEICRNSQAYFGTLTATSRRSSAAHNAIQHGIYVFEADPRRPDDHESLSMNRCIYVEW